MSRVTFFVFKDLEGPLRDVSDKPRFKIRPSGSKGIGGRNGLLAWDFRDQAGVRPVQRLKSDPTG